MKKEGNWPVFYVAISAFLLVIILVGFGGYFYWQLRGENLALTVAKVELENQLSLLKNNLATTTLALQKEQDKNNLFADQISGLAGAVGTLDKLSKTDRELLKKYSKISFLNENYVPLSLATITPAYLANPKQDFKIHANVLPRLGSMIESASSSGVDLKVFSAYRSFGTQASLKAKYLVTYGTGANKFSADQGYSEHQLGTAIDLVPAGSNSLSVDFAKTKAGEWLRDNAYKYGFILSYPQNNAYYQYEPWHWRYVGVALATRLHNEGKDFYFFSQRIIDSYLVNIFD